MNPPVPMRGVGRDQTRGDNRCTPAVLWRAALEAAGLTRFDLDPATNPHATVPALVRYMGPVDGQDGLALPWHGNVWLNFPFSRPKPWIAKIAIEAHRCRSVTVLGPNDSSVDWWQDLMMIVDAAAAWPRRVHFPRPGHPKGSPPGPIALWYIGPQSNGWRRVMEQHGAVTQPGVITRPRPLILGPPCVKRPRPLTP